MLGSMFLISITSSNDTTLLSHELEIKCTTNPTTGKVKLAMAVSDPAQVQLSTQNLIKR